MFQLLVVYRGNTQTWLKGQEPHHWTLVQLLGTPGEHSLNDLQYNKTIQIEQIHSF